MKAFAIDAYKAPLKVHEVAEPVARDGQVIVAIEAASVNPLDVKLRSGAFKAILPYEMPLVLGHDLAGTVIAAEPGVTRVRVGDAVFACVGGDTIGTFAERIAVAEGDLAPKPANLGMEDAAALPLVALTAWQVLVDRAAIKPGDRVLIHAGSGGVGTVAIQLAKHFGAHVATTVGTGSVDLARSLGADVVIDYRKERFEDILTDYDIVLHSLDDDTLQRSLTVLKRGGKLISISGPPDPAFAASIGANWIVRQVLRLGSAKVRRKAKHLGVDYSFHFMRPDGAQLAEIAKLVEAGIVRPVIDQVFPFEETPAALERSASGRARGKVIVRGADTSHGDLAA